MIRLFKLREIPKGAALLAWLIMIGLLACPARAEEGLDSVKNLLHQGKVVQALDEVDKALKQDDLNPLAHFYRGKALLGLQRPGEAFQAFEKVLSLSDPDAGLAYRAETKTNMAVCRHTEAYRFLEQKKYRLALTRIEDAVRIDPGYVPGLLFRGKTYELLGRLEKARSIYENVLELYPRSSEAMHYLGLLLVLMNDLPQATGVFRKLIEIEDARPPALADAHFRVGDDLRDRFDFTGAREHFEKALHYNPDHTSARLTLKHMTARVDTIRRATSAESTLLLAAVFILLAYGVLLVLAHRKISTLPRAGAMGEGGTQPATQADPEDGGA